MRTDFASDGALQAPFLSFLHCPCAVYPEQEEVGSSWMLGVPGKEAAGGRVGQCQPGPGCRSSEQEEVQGPLEELVSRRNQDSSEELSGRPRLCCRGRRTT